MVVIVLVLFFGPGVTLYEYTVIEYLCRRIGTKHLSLLLYELVNQEAIEMQWLGLSGSYNWNKTIPKQIQNIVLFQALLHVKQNTETILKRFGIVLELFQSCFRLINIFIHMSKNMQIPKQFQRSQPITDDHTCITLY